MVIRIRTVALTLGLLLVASGHSWGQESPLSGAFRGEMHAALTTQLDSARAAGLPLLPLIQKALEGRSKGASADQVISAVRGLRARLASAVRALGADADDTAVIAGAAALYLGVDAGVLSKVADEVTPEALPMALVVLGDLVMRGVQVSRAEEALVSLAEVGADTPTLEEFRQQVEEDISTGVAPHTSVDVRSRGVLVTLRRRGNQPVGLIR